MPPTGAGQATFADGLASLLTSLAPLKVLPDADPEVIANLEALIVSAVQSGQAAQMQGQMDALGGGGGLGSSMSIPSSGPSGPPGPMGPMVAGAMGMGAPGPGRGYSPQPAPPNTDELRRILSPG